jgi:hypothetical protein
MGSHPAGAAEKILTSSSSAIIHCCSASYPLEGVNP